MLFGKIEMFGGVQNGMVSKWLCGREISIDARPSDALALSLMVGAPILLAEELINTCTQIDLKAKPEDKSEQGKRWQEILEKLNPEDLGNT